MTESPHDASPGAPASTPGLRLFELLESLAALGRAFTLADAVQASGWPKPTVHRMLQQLEAGELLQREPDGRRYQLGARLLQLAEGVMRGGQQQGLRRAVLRQLVADVGESCNLTALSGAEVVYLDRVETAFPLRMELRPGMRVPLHCSASGKLFLALMPAGQRRRMLAALPLAAHTPHTITAPGPFASSRARAWVSGLPRGDISSRGRGSFWCETASIAAASTSGFSTMPAPPPAGVSSTVRWRSVAKSRICTVSSDQSPRTSALPDSDWPRNPGNISG